MSKQEELRDQVIEQMVKWGITTDWGNYNTLANDIITLVVNDMISKLQAEIKG